MLKLFKFAYCFLLAVGVPIHAQAAERPNIVVLIGDDVGYSDLGAYGGEIDTPNLDALAAAGTLFSNYHTTASCSPTRSMLMTGVDNHRNGLGNMDVTMPFEHKGKPGYDGELNHQVVTLAQMLRDSGYHTYHIGKWHLGITPDKLPINRGFERTITLGDTGADNWEQKSYLPLYDKANWFADGKEHQLPDDFYSSKYFVDKAIEFIDSNQGDGKPFLTYIGFQAVHIPIQAPASFVKKYEGRYQDGWTPIRQQRLERAVQRGLVAANTQLAEVPSTLAWDSLTQEEKDYSAQLMAVYAGMLDAMDHHIGRLIAHLKQIGEYDNTVFVFVSDNGAEPSDPMANKAMARWVRQNYSLAKEDLGAKGSYGAIGPSWASAAASPGAYFKFWAGEGGLRVPMIVSWPTQLPAGRVDRSFAYVKDVMPTLLEFARVSAHDGKYQGRDVEPITGSSLAPLLRGEVNRTHASDKPIGYELAGNAALYKGDYKLVHNLKPLGDGEWHLYNIVKDPGEAKDLSERMPERFEAMLADFAAYEKDNNVLPMPEGYEYTKQVLKFTQRALLKRWWHIAFVIASGAVLVLFALLRWRRLRRAS